jgi:hypothetical protein
MIRVRSICKRTVTDMADYSLVTPEGKQALADLLFQVMEENGITSQVRFAQFLAERSGLTVKENRVQRLIKGHYDDATVTLLVPIVKAKILKLPSGEFYTFDDLVDLLCGILDPKTGERRDHSNNHNHVN